MNKPYIKALGAAAYIVLITSVMRFITDHLSAKPDTAFAPMLFLSLFVVSAAVMAWLFFYEPVKLLTENKRGEAVSYFGKTLGIFVVFAVAMLILNFIAGPREYGTGDTSVKIYRDLGITFRYPTKLNTGYASLTVETHVEKVDPTKLDANGCYPGMNGLGTTASTTVTSMNHLKICSTISTDVGAGQLYTTYSYSTIRSGIVYTVDYVVHTSNGCGAYLGSEDPGAPENNKYRECVEAQKNFDATVVAPIRESIGTFRFLD